MTKTPNRFGQLMIAGEVRWRRNSQVAAVHQGLRMVLPLILLGALADFINQSWLRPDGYYYQTLHVTRWLVRRVRLQEGLLLLQNGAWGLATLGVAFVISFQLVRRQTRVLQDGLTAGLVAVLGLEIVNADPTTLAVTKPLQWLAMNLGLQGLPLGFLMGLLVGNGYAWGVKRWATPRDDLARPMTLGLTGMVTLAGLGTAWLMTTPFSLHTAFNTLVHGPLQWTNDVWRLLGFSSLNGFFSWLGVVGPLPSSGGQSFAAAENLAAVLYGNGGSVPHPLTLQSVLQTYANMGGPGMGLALLLAIFLVQHNASQRRIGWLSLIPVLGNFDAPLLTGMPVVLSPILGLPLILAPLASILVSCGFLSLHWVPATAFPLPVGTPGPLLGYLGSGGALTPVVLAVVNLVIGTAIYYPFVKWAQLAQDQLDAGEDD